MGTIDSQTKAYLSNAERFADAFNFLIYDGEQVIKAENLRELDTTEIVLPYANEKNTSLQKVRDVLKLLTAMQDDEAIYLMLGIEAQAAVHYAMPVRNMLYDAMSYAEQVKRIGDTHRENNDRMTQEEYLSGFRKDDRLMPVITLVLSLSADEWDGALSIHELLNTKNARLLSFVPDYRINLISPSRIDDSEFEKFRTGIGTLMQFIKHKRDKNMDWISRNSRFRNVSRDTAELIRVLSGKSMSFDEEGETVNMWEAWDNSIKEARINGQVESAMNVAKKFHLTVEEAMDAVGIVKSEWDVYAPMIEARLNAPLN